VHRQRYAQRLSVVGSAGKSRMIAAPDLLGGLHGAAVIADAVLAKI
jgi:hypothetical protein